jgi:putative ABC transport system permease protein
MLVGETLRVALTSLRANKLRSFLTMLGIVIGVGAVIAMIAIGRGAQKAILDRLNAMGPTLLSVTPGSERWGRRMAADNEKLTLDDMEALRKGMTHLRVIEPEIQKRNGIIQTRLSSAPSNVVGTLPNYLQVRNFKLAAGRMFTDSENEAMERVAVVGSTVIDNLGLTSPEAVLNEIIKIGTIDFKVVGVLQEQSNTGGWQNPNDVVLVPFNTAHRRVIGNDFLSSIGMLVDDPKNLLLSQAQITSIIRRQHKLPLEKRNDFQIWNQTDQLDTLQESTQTFTMLLSAIAAVSLLVGGIGIMNIMLVSVTERTREIGIRKALGASSTNILTQFLIEAVFLCLAGGAIGTTIGVYGAHLLDTIANFNTQVDLWAILLAFGFSAAVGLVFGVWPARRAAKLDPIVALRYE